MTALGYSFAVLVVVGLVANTAPAMDRKPYCDGYRDVLRDAVENRRQDYPNYAESLVQMEWRDDVDFIFQQAKGFNYRDWINERYRECWEQTPYGPSG